MAERPIIFSESMVQAILDGRKLQTRRTIRPQPPRGALLVGLEVTGAEGVNRRMRATWEVDRWLPYADCAYGQRGDRLWAREAAVYHDGRWRYQAGDDSPGSRADLQFSTPIRMPRAAARIWLEVTAIRVERLHDITQHDCVEEGITLTKADAADPRHDVCHAAFRRLWETINGTRAWDLNPWVWVISFTCSGIEYRTPDA